MLSGGTPENRGSAADFSEVTLEITPHNRSFQVGREGLEPPTRWVKANCATIAPSTHVPHYIPTWCPFSDATLAWHANFGQPHLGQYSRRDSNPQSTGPQPVAQSN